MLQNLFARVLPRRLSRPDECASVRARLFLYLDNALDTRQQSKIESHVAQCPQCREELAACRRAETALCSAASALASPGDMRTEFYARLTRERRSKPSVRWGLAVPAVACLALMWVAIDHPSGSKTGVRTDGGMPGAVRQSEIVRSLSKPHTSGLAVAARPGASKPGRGVGVPHGRELAWLNQGGGSGPHAAHRGSRGPAVHRSPRAQQLDALIALNTAETPQEKAPLSGGAPTVLAAVARNEPSVILGMVSEDRNETRPSGHAALASLETELHVSDEARDFMSSTRVNSIAPHRDTAATLRVEDENSISGESVELPALP